MNQIFYLQTDDSGKINNITQDDKSNDSNWILGVVPKYEVTAFKNHYDECNYDSNMNAIIFPDDFASDGAIPSGDQGQSIITRINNHLNDVDNELANIKNNNTFQISDDNDVYGVAWNRGAGNTLNNGMTRIDDAKGMSSQLNNGHNDFDQAGPYQWKRVTDNYGNAFMRIPRIYLKKTKTGSEDNGQVTWECSLNRFPGSYLPKCFVKYDSNNNIIGFNDYVDVGCYDANLNGSLLASNSGKAPLVNNGIDNFRQFARNNGQGYQLLDIHVWDLLRTLFVIEFATLQSDSVFHGYRGGNSPVNSGFTDGISAPTGQASNGTFKYRGIENLYSNIGLWIDGINFDLQTGHKIYVCDNADKYASQVYAYPYQLVGYTWQWGETMDEGFDRAHPEVNINDSTNQAPYRQHQYYCDWQGGWTGDTVAYVGNPWDNADNGIFYLNVDTPSAQWPSCGSRLVRKQQ